MYLVVGGNSEIGSATAGLLAARGHEVLVTTRRPEAVGAGQMLLDFDTLDAGWMPPPGVRAVCIFVAVARLAECENAPEASARINVTDRKSVV